MILLANLIGLVGYFVLLWATQHRAKRGFLAVDIAGSAIVGVQYLLLGVVSAALLNVVFVLADTLALLPPRWKRLYPVVYLLTLAIGTLFWGGVITVFVVLAGLLAFAGRHQASMVRLRWLIIAMAVSFGVVGVLSSSYAQVAFSLFYIAANIRQLYFVKSAPPPAVPALNVEAAQS